MNESGVTHICKSCGQSFVGVYCNQCGEKVLLPSDRSFKKFLSNVLVAITFADNRFVKALWLVLSKPGFLSKEFAEGKTVKYLKPINLFFVLNLVYFFFPVIQLFNASLNTQLLSPLGDWYQTLVARKIVAMGIDVNSFSLIYNLKTTGFAKLMVMVFVVIASLPHNLFYYKRNRFFTDHVGLMIELACFNLFVNAIVLKVITDVAGLGSFLDEMSLTVIFTITNLYFLLRASKTFYAERGVLLVFKSVVMILFLKVSLEIYRSVLFFITLWSL